MEPWAASSSPPPILFAVNISLSRIKISSSSSSSFFFFFFFFFMSKNIYLFALILFFFKFTYTAHCRCLVQGIWNRSLNITELRLMISIPSPRQQKRHPQKISHSLNNSTDTKIHQIKMFFFPSSSHSYSALFSNSLKLRFYIFLLATDCCC